ncbi:MAG: hypothetical protein Fur0044_36980 [Anaerolineae bacterium]|nr:hypothetical protein [Anaerolineales bacterium]MCQ3980034.1 hypothetical protein [Anaerolineae bacterium]
MDESELRNEIRFGLENLAKIYLNISKFAQQDIDEEIKVAALTYECFGYYNAIEHLVIRILKHQKVRIPAGQFSHRDTLKSFEALIAQKVIKADEEVIKTIENLMAFRHVATKIYSFLIDWNKLQIIIDDIEKNHQQIQQFFTDILDAL